MELIKPFMWNHVSSLRTFSITHISTKMEFEVCKLSTPGAHTDIKHSYIVFLEVFQSIAVYNLSHSAQNIS